MTCDVSFKTLQSESKHLDHRRPYKQEAMAAIIAKIATLTSKPHLTAACVHELLQVSASRQLEIRSQEATGCVVIIAVTLHSEEDHQPLGSTLPAVCQL